MRRGLLAILAAFTLALGAASSSPVDAATQVIVTPSNLHGWCLTAPCGADNRTSGTVGFVADPTAHGYPHRGALELKTGMLDTAAKAQALHPTNVSILDVYELGYWTKQVSGPPFADPAYQLAICANGIVGSGCAPNLAPSPTSSFTTLVFEPYQNTAQGPIVPDVWQHWDVDQGLFWSSRVVTCTHGVLAGSSGGGPAIFTLAAIKTMCPEAVVVQFLVNVGTNNPGYNVRADLFDFNGTVYNFEPDAPACRDSHGNGDFNNDRGEHGNFSFTHRHCDGEVDEDHFDSSDRGDGKDFHSSSVSSAVIDDNAHTITMTGVGSSTGGLPVTFVLVAIESTATTPGWVSMNFGDGYTTAGDLLSGAVSLQ
jgi:hypothetical protein